MHASAPVRGTTDMLSHAAPCGSRPVASNVLRPVNSPGGGRQRLARDRKPAQLSYACALRAPAVDGGAVDPAGTSRRPRYRQPAACQAVVDPVLTPRPHTLRAIRSCSENRSPASPSDTSDQRCGPLPASMSWTVTRRRGPCWRTDPPTSVSTSSRDPSSLTSRFTSRNANEGGPRWNAQPGNIGQRIEQLLRKAVAEVPQGGIAAEIFEGQDGNGVDWSGLSQRVETLAEIEAGREQRRCQHREPQSPSQAGFKRRDTTIDRRDESKADARNRLDDGGAPGAVAEGLAQLDDALCERVLGDDGVSPDRAQQLVLTNDLANGGGQAAEHGHGARREAMRVRIPLHAQTPRLDPPWADPE